MMKKLNTNLLKKEQLNIISRLIPLLAIAIVFLDYEGTAMHRKINLTGPIKLIQIIMMIIYTLIFNRAEVRKKYFFLTITYITIQCISFLSRGNISFIEQKYLVKDVLVGSMLPIYFSYFMTYIDNMEKEDYNWYSRVFILFISLISLYNIFINWRSINLLFDENVNPYFINFSSIFQNRNSFALVLFLAIVLLVYENRLSKYCKYGLLILFFFNLVGTLSRTAFISLLIFLVMHFYIKKTRNQNVKIKQLIRQNAYLISGVFIILIIAAYYSGFLDKFFRVSFGSSGRLDLWRISLKIFKENPLFGLGISNAKQRLIYYDPLNIQFHNMFFESLPSFGLIGLFLNFMLLYCFMIKTRNGKEFKFFIPIYSSLFFYSLFESLSFFRVGYVSIFLSSFLIVASRLIQENNYRHLALFDTD